MNIEQTLQQAITYHKAGACYEAERLYRSILNNKANHPDANHNLGVLLKQGEQMDIALPYFKTALDSNPNQGRYWVSYIDTLIHLGQLDVASIVLEQGQSKGLKGDAVDQLKERLNSKVKPNPESVDTQSKTLNVNAILKQAKSHAKKGQLDEARKLYHRVLEAFPQNQQAKKGLKALQKGQVNKKNPSGPPQPQIDEVMSLYSKGQLEEALNISQVLIKDYPNSPLLYNINGACNKALGQMKEAVKCYEQALAINPRYADAHNNFGLTLHKLGQLEEAVKCYEQAISIKPNYAEAHYNLGNTLQKLGQLKESVKCYEQAIVIKPDLAEAYSNLGITLNDLGQLEAAVKSYEQALAIKPGYAEAHSNLGVTLKELGQLEKAVKRYEQALAIKPDYAETHSNLCVTLKELGQLEAAVKSCEQVLVIKPDDAETLIQLSIYSWIDQDLDKLKSYLTSKMDLNKCSKKSLKFVYPYLNFLTQLHKYRLTYPHQYLCNDQSPVIHVIGESHCLTAANSNVEFMGKFHTMKSNVIIGCKAWHLANSQVNGYKKQLEAMVATIPNDGIVMITFGEIDCRLDEGILKFHQKTQNNLVESIKDLVENYTKYIIEKLAGVSRIIIVSGVPCISKSRQQNLTEDNAVILSTVLSNFNKSLKTTAINRGLKFLDLYSLTQENPEAYFIDDHHLTPSALVKAIQTKLI
jgi:tetratricopeptide (TPR) repeat protein